MALKHLGICAGLQLGDPRGVRNLLGRSGGHPGIVDHGTPLPLGSPRPWPTGAHSQCGDPGRAGESSGGRWTQWHGLWAGPSSSRPLGPDHLPRTLVQPQGQNVQDLGWGSLRSSMMVLLGSN